MMTYSLDRELFEDELEFDDELEWFSYDLEAEFNRKSRAYIKWVQRSLNRPMNARLVIDGIIGTNTRRAIRNFQRWVGIRVDGIVGSQTERALIRAGAGSPPRVSRTKTTKFSWLKKVVPILNRYRGHIPLDLLLGWIAVESGGRLSVTTRLDERGYFQLHPGESKTLKLNHQRLSTDPIYSLQAGIKLIRHYAKLAQRLGFTAGTNLFWRIVKFLHAMGSGAVPLFLRDMQQHGIQPSSWAVIKNYAASNRQRIRRLFKRRFGKAFDPVKWTKNVDKVFIRGQQLTKQLANP